MVNYAIRMITHRGKPDHYEVYNTTTRLSVGNFKPTGDEHDLSAALDRARAYVEQLNKDDEHA